MRKGMNYVTKKRKDKTLYKEKIEDFTDEIIDSLVDKTLKIEYNDLNDESILTNEKPGLNSSREK